MSYNLPTIAATLAAIRGRLVAAEWQSTPAFGEVTIFEAADLPRAMERFISSAPRLCFVVYTGDTFDGIEQGQRYGIGPDLKLHRGISLLVSDRWVENVTYAMQGTEDNPGAYALAEIAIGAIGGRIQDGPPAVFVTPKSVTPIAVAESENEPGRGGVEVVLECWTDWRQLTA